MKDSSDEKDIYASFGTDCETTCKTENEVKKSPFESFEDYGESLDESDPKWKKWAKSSNNLYISEDSLRHTFVTLKNSSFTFDGEEIPGSNLDRLAYKKSGFCWSGRNGFG